MNVYTVHKQNIRNKWGYDRLRNPENKRKGSDRTMKKLYAVEKCVVKWASQMVDTSCKVLGGASKERQLSQR